MDFAAIIAETKRPVLAAIRRHLSPRFAYAIDDVAQEVYLRAYCSLMKGKLNDASKLRSYLYTIAKNEALRMNFRCEREEKKAEKYLTAWRGSMVATENGVAEYALAGELQKALRQIPPHYAAVVELSLAGFSAAEIVQELEIKPGTVKSRLSRGLALLRQKLA